MKILYFLPLLLTGCMSLIEYDAEKLEAEQIKHITDKQKYDPFAAPPTPDYVKLIENDDVYVEVFKLKPEFPKNYKGVKLDSWKVTVTNKTSATKCVIIDWKLQDFEFESDEPIEFIVQPNKTIKLGKMKQTIWSFDGAYIALPPSGYIKDVDTKNAIFDYKNSTFNCEMPEEDIDDKNIKEK